MWLDLQPGNPEYLTLLQIEKSHKSDAFNQSGNFDNFDRFDRFDRIDRIDEFEDKEVKGRDFSIYDCLRSHGPHSPLSCTDATIINNEL